jgi:hypothetical protein
MEKIRFKYIPQIKLDFVCFVHLCVYQFLYTLAKAREKAGKMGQAGTE